MSASPSQSTETMIAKDGTPLFTRHFPAGSDPRACMVIVHGLCEHSGRYEQMAEFLNERGIRVTAYDQRGHGQSGGARGHVQDFDHLTDDLMQVIQKCRQQMDENLPVLILGHSMGGLVVLRFAQRFGNTVSGVIASSPALAPAVSIPPVQAALGRLMSRIRPQLTFDNQLAPEHISHEDSVVQAYISDPLVLGRVSARLFTEMTKTMERTNQDAPVLSVPLLLQAAGDDRLVDPGACRKFFEHIGASDKTLHVYPGLFHEIYNEEPSRRQQVLTDLEAWLESHVR
ncbi:MAG: lysophospholipase [Desulfobacteraceae bacterium]|nr:lysophospholipase [Desulfobacteraceae bacterium]